MQNILFATALLALLGQAIAGGPEVCVSKGPANCVDRQVTKGTFPYLHSFEESIPNLIYSDCCVAVNHDARFDEVFNQCVPWNVNGLDTGAMVECCESRGCGSRAEGLGASHTVC